MRQQVYSFCIIVLVLGQAFSIPHHSVYKSRLEDERKYAEKPNAVKKVVLEENEDINNNSIQEGTGNGFSWSNMLAMVMQMLLGPANGMAGPSKNDIEDNIPASPWANLISVGLRLLTAILGGAQQQTDGIDKVDNPNNGPMQQFINIVINLLDALKTSFSHRSLHARSLGRRDSLSEAAVASISMLKGYVRTMKSYKNVEDSDQEGQRGCAERALCEANAECASDAEVQSSIFCQLGSYATSYLLQRQSGVNFEALHEAGRRGRSGEDCRTLYLDCNAV